VVVSLFVISDVVVVVVVVARFTLYDEILWLC
jgi:hypothetical protein